MYLYLFGYLFILPFIMASAAHLTACFKGNEEYADKSKLFLMPLLLVFYIAASLFAASRIFWTAAAALILSTAGDYFMRAENNRKSIIAGIISFSAAQICFILFAVPKILWERLPGIAIIGIGFVYLAGFLFTVFSLRTHTAGVRSLVTLYTLFICFMSYFFVLMAIALPGTGTVLTAAGGFLFIVSDTLLSQKIFVKSKLPKARFMVMLSYLAAETLIIWGILFLAPVFS